MATVFFLSFGKVIARLFKFLQGFSHALIKNFGAKFKMIELYFDLRGPKLLKWDFSDVLKNFRTVLITDFEIPTALTLART